MFTCDESRSPTLALMKPAGWCPSIRYRGGALSLIAGIILPFVALATQGCAFSDLKVFPPQDEILGQNPSLGRGREVILVTPFADQRPFPARCGMKKNNIDMDTADVLCSVPPPRWLSGALAHALTTAGFRVKTNPASQTTASVRIDGTVLQFFLEAYHGFFLVTPEADISVRLVVSSQSGLYAERTFYVKGAKPSVVCKADDYQEAADNGTKDAVTAMVKAIATLLDRYPQLGIPASLSMLNNKESGQ